jgi:hypothetical protein
MNRKGLPALQVLQMLHPVQAAVQIKTGKEPCILRLAPVLLNLNRKQNANEPHDLMLLPLPSHLLEVNMFMPTCTVQLTTLRHGRMSGSSLTCGE